MSIFIYSHSFQHCDGVSSRFNFHSDALSRGAKIRCFTSADEKCDKPYPFVFLEGGVKVPFSDLQFSKVSLKNFFTVLSYLRAETPDIVHATYDMTAYMWLLACTLTRTPLVFSFHTNVIHFLAKHGVHWSVIRFCNANENLVAMLADNSFTMSKSYRDVLRSRGVSVSSDITWGCTVDKNVFRTYPDHDKEVLRQQWNWEEGIHASKRRYLLTAGRVSEEKNLDFLVKVVSSLRSIDRSFVLVIVGSGPAEQKLRSLHGCEHGIYFENRFLDQKELSKWYSAADLYVSASTFESLGLTVVESMSCGTPVVVPRTSGFIDTVTDGQNGFFFNFSKTSEEKSVRAAVTAINRALEKRLNCVWKPKTNPLHQCILVYKETKQRFISARSGNILTPVLTTVMFACSWIASALNTVYFYNS